MNGQTGKIGGYVPDEQKKVDMLSKDKVRTGRSVDMFLTAILRTGTKNDYLFRFLVPRRNSRETHSRRVVTLRILSLN